MAQLDSLLRIVVAQGADELRFGSDESPAMFAAGVPRKLTIPPTPTETLLDLFGDLLSEERRATLAASHRLELRHEPPGLGAFQVILVKRSESGAITAVVRRDQGGAVTAAPPVAPARSARVDGTPAGPTPGAGPALVGPGSALVGVAPHPSAPAPSPAAAAHLQAVLRAAADLGASDLHLADGEPPTARIDGRLQVLDAHRSEAPLSALVEGLLGPADRARLEARSSCDVGLDVPEGRRARMNVFRTMNGLAAAVRFLPRAPRALQELGLPPEVEELALLSSGLVLATGATGSGKSTTLAALAALALRRRSIVLVTLEDPIEYVFESTPGSLVRQRQLGREFPDFPTGLRDALREDPDVILIGEMRDAESIALALTAAETGHLVFASLHARSAASAVDRILDATPGERLPQVRQQLADSLRAVVAQRLLPREGGGRVLAAEVLRNVPAVANGIREGKTGTVRTAMQAGRSAGMITLERALAELVQVRAISQETARRAANEPEGLASYLTGR